MKFKAHLYIIQINFTQIPIDFIQIHIILNQNSIITTITIIIIKVIVNPFSLQKRDSKYLV